LAHVAELARSHADAERAREAKAAWDAARKRAETAMAEARHVQIAPHLYCGPVVGAANIQLATCSPNFLMQEGILDWGGFHAQILKKGIEWEDGYIIPPTAPGLGIELDEEVARQHPYNGSRLHLDMTHHPIVG
jgi:L-alanine-DL-glutamate epimerase-like enolase superfamily enzyme